ncbi:MAG TPA: DUF882 domain-containing protein [Polyangiaceae bacterium]
MFGLSRLDLSRKRGVALLALCAAFGLSALAATHQRAKSWRTASIQPPAPAPAKPQATSPAVTSAAPAESPFERLPKVHIVYLNTHEAVDTRLYAADGKVDEGEAKKLDVLLCDARDTKHIESTRLERRTLQLVYRAALHFKATTVEVVSAYRKPGRRPEGPHASGAAVDFRLPGVTAALLAQYLRELPRVGVGVYTHPRTQYVHLDTREHSYHWLDASPPGRTWRERGIGGKAMTAHDANYTPQGDLPEGMGGS